MADTIQSVLRNLSDEAGNADAAGRLQDGLSGMQDFSIDEYRPMRVVVVGAGLSGIVAGIRFRQYIPNLDMTIYDMNAGIGGTWYTNKYPGVACDVPSHCYSYSFEYKNDWSSCYSKGPEILGYLNHVVDKWALAPYIKLRHELVHAQWDGSSGKWHLRIRRPSHDGSGYEEFDDEADVVFNGVGLLSRWHWPDIAGLHDFKGTLVHSANWNLGGATWEEDVRDWGDKKVAVIGLGSSALQIVASIQPKVGKLYNVARGRTWVAPPFAIRVYSELLGREVSMSDLNLRKEEIQALRDDPEKSDRLRRTLEESMNSNHSLTLLDSELQKIFRPMVKDHMIKTLAKKPWIAEQLIPDFPLSARRLSPAPGYLEALCADNCDFINQPISRVTPTGIVFEDGKSIDLDVIICATGFDTSWLLPFPIVGRDGVELKDKWTPYPRTYLSLCTDGFPNMFFPSGPNSTIGTAGLPIMIEHQTQYAVMAVMKLQRERLKSIEPKPEAIADFEAILDDYFKKTVFSTPVATWYRAGRSEGRVTTVWPGSNLHCIRALRNPRWEDFNYERVDKINNRLFWLGDGMSHSEKTGTGDRIWYLNDNYLDIPPTPEYS